MEPTKNILKKSKSTFGFTLVELIVVITILVILGTIAFVSLGWFSASARDGLRIENLANLHKGLSLFQIKSGTYPMPEAPLTISASGTTIGYQGFAKDQVQNIAKLSAGGTQDPSDAGMYTTYLVNTARTKMQVTGFLEDGSTVAFLPEAFASVTSDYTARTPITLGDTIGVILSTATGNLNQPLQEKVSGSFTGIDLAAFSGTLSDGTSASLKALITNTESIGGTWWELLVLESNVIGKMRIVMHACPTAAGWTDLGIAWSGPWSIGATSDNITFTGAHLCEVNNNAIIPKDSIILARSGTCNSTSFNDTGWLAGSGAWPGRASCDATSVSDCHLCKTIADSPLPTGIVMIMQSCPSSWSDMGAPYTWPTSAGCLYWMSCRICQKQ